jgi:hypothetical protein
LSCSLIDYKILSKGWVLDLITVSPITSTMSGTEYASDTFMGIKTIKSLDYLIPLFLVFFDYLTLTHYPCIYKLYTNA